MAGYFGAGFAGALQGQNEALANQPAQVARILALKGEMQKQAILNSQLQAQGEAQQSLPLILQGIGQSYYGAEQTPSPGQASIPMQTPTQTSNQSPPVSSLPGISAGQANVPQTTGPYSIMPYREMADIKSQYNNQNTVASTPQQKAPDLQNVYAKIASMSISPMAKQLLLKEVQPIIAQQELAADRRQRMLQSMQIHQDNLRQNIEIQKFREANAITPEERKAARDERAALSLQLADMRKSIQHTANMGNWNQFSALQERMLKPIDEAQTQSQEIRGLLSTDNPAAAAQVQKLLTLYLQRTRFTNLNYGDQRSFGDVYQRFGNAISRWYAGDFTDANKKLILDMLDTMDKTVMGPARTNINTMLKKRLRAQGIDENTADIMSARPATFIPDNVSPGGSNQDILKQADQILSGKP